MHGNALTEPHLERNVGVIEIGGLQPPASRATAALIAAKWRRWRAAGPPGQQGEPSSLVPSSAPLYASFAVKPSGGSSGERVHRSQKVDPPGRTVREPCPGLAEQRRQPRRIQARHRVLGGQERRPVLDLARHEQTPAELELRYRRCSKGALRAPPPRLAPTRSVQAPPRERSCSKPRMSAVRAPSLKNGRTNRGPTRSATEASPTRCPPREPPRASSRTSP